jgi:hypothetical protein
MIRSLLDFKEIFVFLLVLKGSRVYVVVCAKGTRHLLGVYAWRHCSPCYVAMCIVLHTLVV